ncbi:MAG: hypothetical protein R3357_06815 [Burkholderiales bacterium]|nr:hypothetical protein [Burkholderiales bacterium]
MPNGFHGSEHEWERFEAPLRALDRRLEQFALQHNMRFARSRRNWPSRSLHWGDNVQRMIQIYLDDPAALTWSLWACASQDRLRRRYWKSAFLRRSASFSEVDADLSDLLAAARELADAWEAGDLEPAA